MRDEMVVLEMRLVMGVVRVMGLLVMGDGC